MILKRTISLILLFSVCAAMLSCSGDSRSASRLNPDSGGKTRGKVVLATDFQVTNDPTDQSQPAVAYDSVQHNRYLTVFVDNRNGSQIYGAICIGNDSLGQGVTGNVTSITPSPVNFAITNTAGNKAQPKVAFYPNPADHTQSRYLVVWTDSRNGYGQIYGQLLDDTGALVGSNFPVTTHTAGVDINQNDPDIIYNAVTGKFVVAWVDTTNKDITNLKVYTAAAVTDGSSTTVIYIPYPTADNNMVRTANVDPVSSAVSNVSDVSRLVSNGDYFDNGTDTITESWNVQLNEAHPKLSYSPISGEVFTVWSGTTSKVTLTLKYQLKTITGPPEIITAIYFPPAFSAEATDGGLNKIQLRRNAGLGLVKDFTFGTTGFAANNPSLATDPNTNRLLIVWEDNNGGIATGKNVKGQLIDLSGFTQYGNPIDISVAQGDQTSPVSSFDNVNQRFLVLWEDARNQSANLSNIDIYSQFVDPQGNLSGGNAIVTVAPGNQLAPAVVFGDVNFRKFFVVWKDGRALSNADIFGQMMEFSSAAQLVVNDATNNPIFNGSIDFGSVATGQFKDVIVFLKNDGNSQLTIKAPGAANSQTALPVAPYTVMTPLPATINPGTSYQMSIRFFPIAAGSFTGDPTNPQNLYKLVIDSDGGTAVLNLSGSGVGINTLSVTTTSLPDANTNVAYSTTVGATGGVFPYSWSATGLPTGLSINANTGAISGTPTVSGTSSVTVTVTDNNSPKTSASKTFSLKVGVVSITSTTLKSWTQGVDYALPPAQTIAASGGTGPYTFAISAGSLPSGMSLSAGGLLTGAPTASGNFSFTVRATDSIGQSSTQPFTMAINPAPAILTSSLAGGVVGVPYSQTVRSTGGTLPNTWALTSSALPGGLTFDSGTGIISGTPTTSGTYPVTFSITDATGASASRAMSIQINSVLDLSTPTSGAGSPPSGQRTIPYSFTFTASGGTQPYSWSVTQGSLPAGLTLDPATGLLSGTPTNLGTVTYRVQLQDASGIIETKLFSTTVADPMVITTTSLSSWTQGVSGYTQTLAVTGGSTPLTWAITSGNGAGTVNPAPGLTLNTSSGAITGTPTTAGSYTFTLTATDSSIPALTATKQLNILVNQPLAIDAVTLSDASQNVFYQQQLSATGGTAPLFWSINSGSLPTGLSIGSLSGFISGIPTSLGTSNFTVRVIDGAGAVATLPLTLTISTSGTSNGGGGTNVGVNTVPASSGGKSGCFIATAAFGSYLDPHVMVLRHFRDDFLLKSRPGTAFVHFYYRYSPPVADFIREHPVLRLVTRWALTPLIFAVKYPVSFLVVFAWGVIGLVRANLRRTLRVLAKG